MKEREKALAAAVQKTLDMHERFGHQSGQHEGSVTCWLPEADLRAALMAENKDEEKLAALFKDLVEFLEDRADVKDGPEGPTPDKAMLLLYRARQWWSRLTGVA